MPRPTPPCGTRAGYRLHVRVQGRPKDECELCHTAEVQYWRDKRNPEHPDYRGNIINKLSRRRRFLKRHDLPKINYRVRNETLEKRDKRRWGWEIYTTEMIIERWGTICYLCDEEIDLEAPRTNPEGLHLDHVIPISKKGCDIIDNVKPTHARCNLAKSDKLWLNGELV